MDLDTRRGPEERQVNGMVMKESETVELKRSTSELKEGNISIASILNKHSHGKLYFGVRNNGKVIGQKVSDKTLRDVSQAIANHIEPRIFPEVEEVVLEGKTCVRVTFSGKEAPYYAYGRAYLRVGDEDRLMSAKELERVILRKNMDKLRWDIAVCKDATIEDLNKRKIRQYLKMREKERNIPAKIPMGMEQFLKNIGALTEQGAATNAGIAFFGKNPKRWNTSIQLRLVRFKGTNKAGLILDKFDCQGTLWEMVDQGEEFIRRNIKLIGYKPKDSWRRKDTFDYPVDALKEAIINALIHRDYWMPGEVIVYIYDDHLEIYNRGGFPEGVTPQKPKHVPRNPLLSEYMYDIGYIEKFGSGIISIRELCKENGNPMPKYETDEYTTVVMFQALEPQVTVEEVIEEPELNKRQQRALAYVKKRGSINRSVCAKLNKVSLATAKRDLTELASKGFLKREGRGKATYYVLV